MKKINVIQILSFIVLMLAGIFLLPILKEQADHTYNGWFIVISKFLFFFLSGFIFALPQLLDKGKIKINIFYLAVEIIFILGLLITYQWVRVSGVDSMLELSLIHIYDSGRNPPLPAGQQLRARLALHA